MPKQVEVQIPQELQTELTLLRGLRDLMAERVGYKLGAGVFSAEMREKTKDQSKAVTDARKYLRENLEGFIKNGDFEGYQKAKATIESAASVLKEARAPFMEKITPLRRAVKFIDDIAVPRFLVETGVTPTPIFNVSDILQKEIEAHKQKKKE